MFHLAGVLTRGAFAPAAFPEGQRGGATGGGDGRGYELWGIVHSQIAIVVVFIPEGFKN